MIITFLFFNSITVTIIICVFWSDTVLYIAGEIIVDELGTVVITSHYLRLNSFKNLFILIIRCSLKFPLPPKFPSAKFQDFFLTFIWIELFIHNSRIHGIMRFPFKYFNILGVSGENNHRWSQAINCLNTSKNSFILIITVNLKRSIYSRVLRLLHISPLYFNF